MFRTLASKKLRIVHIDDIRLEMTWAEYIRQFRAIEVQRWTGAPPRTVYSWRNGAEPPAWTQAILRERIDRMRSIALAS